MGITRIIRIARITQITRIGRGRAIIPERANQAPDRLNERVENRVCGFRLHPSTLLGVPWALSKGRWSSGR